MELAYPLLMICAKLPLEYYTESQRLILWKSDVVWPRYGNIYHNDMLQTVWVPRIIIVITSLAPVWTTKRAITWQINKMCKIAIVLVIHNHFPWIISQKFFHIVYYFMHN